MAAGFFSCADELIPTTKRIAAIAPKLVQLDRITTSAGAAMDAPAIIDLTADDDAIDEGTPHAEPRAGSTLSSTRE